jgi:hypothetical protein
VPTNGHKSLPYAHQVSYLSETTTRLQALNHRRAGETRRFRNILLQSLAGFTRPTKDAMHVVGFGDTHCGHKNVPTLSVFFQLIF